MLLNIDKTEKNAQNDLDKRPSRRKRGFQIRENEKKETENNLENTDSNNLSV